MTRGARAARGLALAGVVLGAFALRAVGFRHVFPGEGIVAFAFGDPHYHLRLALYALERFPDFLAFDPYVVFPDGAPVAWPPFYDLWVAGSALALGGSLRALELAAAWWPALLGAATALPVYAVGRRVGGTGCGLGAAAIFAVLPASTAVSAVGYADHHAAVAFLGACWLALHAALLEAAASGAAAPRRALVLGAGLAAVRAALLLTWSGGILYLGVAEGSFALFAVALARRRALLADAASLAVTAAAIAPVAARMVAGGAPPFSAVQLSWLSVLGCGALAVAAGLVGLRRPAAGPLRRLLEAAAIGAGVAALLLLVPGLAQQLAHGLGFLAKEDVAAVATPEQQPMLANAGTRAVAYSLLGAWVWLAPAAPLLLGLLAWRERRPALGLVAVWNAAFTVFALGQVRFANDLAPTAAVALALLAAWAGRALAARLGSARSGAGAALAAAAVVLVLWPTVPLNHAPELRRAFAPSAAERGSPEASMVRFAETVRAVTPETSGFFDPHVRPEYGLLCDPSLGHALHYVARRATLADNFGPWAGEQAFVRAIQLLLGAPTKATFGRLRALGARYVVTNWQPVYHEGGLLQRLHAFDGRAHGGRPALEHYRLVAEGPPGGLPLAALLGTPPPSGAVSYKLFEVVEGAQLDVEAAAGSFVSASVQVVSPLGRRFAYRASARAGSDGRARLRVPYATRCDEPVCASGPWRVEVGGVAREVRVAPADVREGRTLAVE